jgi:hypothetical protein
MSAYIIEGRADITALELGIKHELRDLLPALTDEQEAELFDSIDTSGIYSPLVAWNDGAVWWLVDGHNRHRKLLEVLSEYPSFTEPDVVELKADSLDEVKAWVIKEHIGRRNLTPNQLSELRGRLYNSTKLPEGNPQLGKIYPVEKPLENEGKRTSKAIAETFGVSEKTIRNDGDFAKGVEVIEKENPEVAKAIRAGKSPVKKKDVEAIGRGEAKPETNGKPKDAPKLDPSKRPIPKNMEEIFAACKDFNEVSRMLSDALRELKKFIPGNDQPRSPGWEHFRFQQFEAAISAAKAELKFAKPHTTCIKAIHKGSDCPLCRGTEFLVRDTMGRLSDLDKAKLPKESK